MMDIIDKKIINILIQNCRIPTSIIAKSLKISKDSVIYRINNLKKEGYIENNGLFIDVRTLGYSFYQILIQLDADNKEKEEIFEKIKKYKNASWINTFIGVYGLQFVVAIKDSFHFNKIKEEIFELCNHRIKKYSVVTAMFEFEFTNMNPDFDLETNFVKKEDYSFSKELTKRRFPNGENFNLYKPSEIEIRILKELSKNPQISLIEIGENLEIDRKTVKKKIQNLISKKVILSFGTVVNLKKLGYVTYTFLLKLKPDTPNEILKKPFEELNNIFFAAKFYGEYDMLLYLNAKDPVELNNSLDKVNEYLEPYILHKDLVIMDNVLFWEQLSDGFYNHLLENL